MAISTYKTFLMMKGTGDTYSKLIDIKDYPDLGGAPEMLDATTLSHGSRVYVPGIQETEAMTFTANYDSTDFDTLAALKGQVKDFAVWFGGTEAAGAVTPTGENGKFTFSGYLDVFVAGGGVNEISDMTITIAPTTVITKAS